jgi:hypothetical protein
VPLVLHRRTQARAPTGTPPGARGTARPATTHRTATTKKQGQPPKTVTTRGPVAPSRAVPRAPTESRQRLPMRQPTPPPGARGTARATHHPAARDHNGKKQPLKAATTRGPVPPPAQFPAPLTRRTLTPPTTARAPEGARGTARPATTHRTATTKRQGQPPGTAPAGQRADTDRAPGTLPARRGACVCPARGQVRPGAAGEGAGFTRMGSAGSLTRFVTFRTAQANGYRHSGGVLGDDSGAVRPPRCGPAPENTPGNAQSGVSQ